MGLMRAGFHVTGVDINPQPRYVGDCFRIADALRYPLEGYDFIWASPPCQKYTAMKTMFNAKSDHPDLVEPMRHRLISSGTDYVIENVPGAPLLAGSLMLCGTMFDLGIIAANAELRRHRWFECSFHMLAPSCRHLANRVCGVYGGHGRDRRRTVTVVSKQGGYSPTTVGVYGHAGGKSRRDGTQMFNTQERKEAMGIEWMKDYELSQAIPPAYSEFIGKQALEYIRRAA
jgi:DNA (cytosine-5)-methyltransferase 1